MRPLPFIFPAQVSYVECAYEADLSLRFVLSSSSRLAIYLPPHDAFSARKTTSFVLESSTPTFFSSTLSSIISWNDFNIRRGAKRKGEKEGKHSWRVKQSINLLYNYNLHTCSNIRTEHPR